MSRVIYVELDGTLVETGTMKPVEAVVKRIKAALSMGDEVKVLVSPPRFPDAIDDDELLAFARRDFNPWCEKHFGDALGLCYEMYGDMTEFWSHRVVQLEKDTGRRLVPLKSFGG